MPEYLMQRTFFGYLTLIDDFDVQIGKVKEKINTGWNIHLKDD